MDGAIAAIDAMPDTPIIETTRFIMRPLVRADAGPLFPTLSNAEQCRFLTRPHFESEEELADWLTDPDWDGRTWIAESRETGAVVGRFVAVPTPDPEVWDTGYITVSEMQGQGVAQECMQALIDHLLLKEDNRRLTAEIDSGNLASIRLAEKLGFRHEGTLRQHERTHNGICDLMIYGLLRSDLASGRSE